MNLAEASGIFVPKPGLHTIERYEYDQVQAVNWSGLKPYSDSPEKAKWLEINRIESEALTFGVRCHERVLEPDAFAERYAYKPARWSEGGGHLRAVKGKTTAAEAAENRIEKENWEHDNIGREVIDADDATKLEAIDTALHAHPIAGSLLGLESRRELAVLSKFGGVLCKSLVDMALTIPDTPSWSSLGFAPGLWLCDLKTTRDSASGKDFARACAKWGYHGQQGFYQANWERATGETVAGFCFVVVEKSPPFSVGVYRLDDEAEQAGTVLWKRLLTVRNSCYEKLQWPGYTPVLTDLRLPSWA